MGVDSSDYKFIENKNLETVLRLASNAYKSTFEPNFRITIRSTSKGEIQKIVNYFDHDFISYGLQFKTKEVKVVQEKLLKYKDDYRSLSITIPNSRDTSSGLIRMNYNRYNKDATAYISLPCESKEESIVLLSNFLNSINQYSEFGPEEEIEITEFAETIYNLNEQMRSSDKWKFQTGCIDFEPINDRTNRTSQKKPKSISGLKVQFSKIHAIAYKAKGIIDLSRILIDNNYITSGEYNFNSDVKSSVSIVDDIPLDEVSCYFNYNLKTINSLTELDWVLQNNECTIELCDCKFDKDDEFKFSLYIAGNSIKNLDVDLFIDYQSPAEYKDKVLNLFEGKMKHVGDG